MSGWRGWAALAVISGLIACWFAASLWLRRDLTRDHELYIARAVGYLDSWEAAADLDPRVRAGGACCEVVFGGLRRTLFDESMAYVHLPTLQPNRTRIVIFNRKREPVSHYTLERHGAAPPGG